MKIDTAYRICGDLERYSMKAWSAAKGRFAGTELNRVSSSPHSGRHGCESSNPRSSTESLNGASLPSLF